MNGKLIDNIVFVGILFHDHPYQTASVEFLLYIFIHSMLFAVLWYDITNIRRLVTRKQEKHITGLRTAAIQDRYPLIAVKRQRENNGDLKWLSKLKFFSQKLL